MSTDRPFHEWMNDFPDAVPVLLGLKTQAHYHATSPVLKKELRIDAFLEPDDPAAPRLLVELQAYRDDFIQHRIVAEAGLYCEKEHYSGVLHLAVVFTSPSFAKDLSPVKWGLAAGVLEVTPQLVVMDQALGERLLATGDPRLIPLLPLCATEGQVRQEAAKWKGWLDERIGESAQRKTLIGLLGAFVMHRLGKMHVKELNELLGGSMLQETTAGQELMEMGGLRASRALVAQLTLTRFRDLPLAVQQLIDQLPDSTTLAKALVLAEQSKTIREFQRKLHGLVSA